MSLLLSLDLYQVLLDPLNNILARTHFSLQTPHFLLVSLFLIIELIVLALSLSFRHLITVDVLVVFFLQRDHSFIAVNDQLVFRLLQFLHLYSHVRYIRIRTVYMLL